MNHIGVCKKAYFFLLNVWCKVDIVQCTGADAGSGSGLGVVLSVLCAGCSVLVVTGKYHLNFFNGLSYISILF